MKCSAENAVRDHAPVENLEVPRHIAIIMDGNRRWAHHRGLSTGEGHAAGAKALFRTIQEAAASGVEVLTVFAFSTENWQRTSQEVNALLNQILSALDDYTDVMLKEGVKLSTIGDLASFPLGVRERLEQVCKLTEKGSELELVLALNYGGRADICRAVRRLIRESTGELEISEERLAQYLDTASWPDPDLLIRTSGEMRLSNFLLWQISYAELFVSDVLWPDFGAEELRKALTAYRARQRRLGQ